MEELKQRVQKGYSRPWVVSKYSKVGLWPSEQLLCDKFWEPKSRILDLGCGAGRTTVPLAQNGYRVVGMDLAIPMVYQAKRSAGFLGRNCVFGVCDATALPFPENSFTGILFSYNGIELIPKQKVKQQVLEEALRILQPGGHLIFTTHAFEAFNKYAPARIQRLCLHLLNSALGRNEPGAEVGEIIPKPTRTVEVYYMQINSPRTYRKMIRNVGFELPYYNSRSRIDSQKRQSRLADFDPDFKFYVARKPE
ncbi:MAG: methyltransferase domain-containing protein [Candidatus Latescibacterota bacterium]|nr:methyltransferase domain-containing protein [Candidatus Latescibacterota bacterium]